MPRTYLEQRANRNGSALVTRSAIAAPGFDNRPAKSLLKNYNNSSCGGADALTSLLLPYRSLRICSVVAPRHRIRRAHNLNCRSFSTDSLDFKHPEGMDENSPMLQL